MNPQFQSKIDSFPENIHYCHNGNADVQKRCEVQNKKQRSEFPSQKLTNTLAEL